MSWGPFAGHRTTKAWTPQSYTMRCFLRPLYYVLYQPQQSVGDYFLPVCHHLFFVIKVVEIDAFNVYVINIIAHRFQNTHG